MEGQEEIVEPEQDQDLTRLAGRKAGTASAVVRPLLVNACSACKLWRPEKDFPGDSRASAARLRTRALWLRRAIPHKPDTRLVRNLAKLLANLACLNDGTKIVYPA